MYFRTEVGSLSGEYFVQLESELSPGERRAEASHQGKQATVFYASEKQALKNLQAVLGDGELLKDGLVVKNPSANAEDTGSILGQGRPTGEGHGNPLQ